MVCDCLKDKQFLNLEIQRSQYIGPYVIVHKLVIVTSVSVSEKECIVI